MTNATHTPPVEPALPPSRDTHARVAALDLSVVIVNWNAGDLLAACVRSVLDGLGPLTAEIFVVDNASTDGSTRGLTEAFPDIRLIANSENRGFAAANNQALARTRGRHVLLLNPDTIVLGDVLPDAVAWADAHPDAGMIGCQVLEAEDTVQPTCFRFPSVVNTALFAFGLTALRPRGRLLGRLLGRENYGGWDRTRERDVDVISGMFMLVRREALRDVGPLDERYFVYAEETDWCRRFHDAGWRRVFAPQVGRILHVHGGGQCTQHVRTKMYIQLQRSLLQYHAKHHGITRERAIRALLLLAMAGRWLWWSTRAAVTRDEQSRRRRQETAAAIRFHRGRHWGERHGGTEAHRH